MKMTLTDEDKRKIFEEVRQYLADELEVEKEKITENTNIIEDLGGDSILFLEMIEEFKARYGISLEVRIIGQYMLKHPVYTVGETLNAMYDIIQRGEELIKELEKEEVLVEQRN